MIFGLSITELVVLFLGTGIIIFILLLALKESKEKGIGKNY